MIRPHAPTPFYIDGIHPRLIRSSVNDVPVAICEISAYMRWNAEFIVQACNAHDDLMEACKFVLQEWHDHGFHESRSDFDKSHDRLQAAIAKATE